MGRKKRDYLAHADYLAKCWGEWVARHIDDAGYPSMTVEARLMHGGVTEQTIPGSRVPNVMMPAHVARVDRIVRRHDTPPEHSQLLLQHYVKGQKVSRGRHSNCLHWLHGALMH